MLKVTESQWSTEEISLIGVATRNCQKVQLRSRLNTFGNNPETQALAKSDDSLGDCCIIGINQDIADKGLVNFQLIQRQAFQI